MRHTCTRHEPGSVQCHERHHCQCHDCRAVSSAYRRQRYRVANPRPVPPPDLDEVAWLLEMGEAPQIVASRMGSTVGAIARRARRLGHVDTARQFEREVRAERAAA